MGSRKSVRRAMRVVILFIVIGIMVFGNPVGYNSDLPTGSTGQITLFAPSFDGAQYSSTFDQRSVSEYLLGKNETTMRNIGTGILIRIDGPDGSGWTGQSLSANVYSLFENTSFVRNEGFLYSTLQGSQRKPDYWSNYTNKPTVFKTDYDNTSHQVYLFTDGSIGNWTISDYANWSQVIYVDRSALQNATIQFKARRGTNFDSRLNASVYVNQQKVWSSQSSALSTSLTTYTINMRAAQFPSIPGSVVITLKLQPNTNASNPPKKLFYMYFDDVYLYMNCKPYPQSIQLKMNHDIDSSPVIGGQYGTGTTSLSLSTPPPFYFTFTSNSTGKVSLLKCNSTISIYRQTLTDSVTYKVVKSAGNAYYNVSKLSYLDVSPKMSGTTRFMRDILNISIPHDWSYDRVLDPNGNQVANSTGQVMKYENSSYSWIMMINVTAIGIYRPNPYRVQSHSTNYVGEAATYRSELGLWVTTDTFGTGKRIKINATVQGQATKGSAYTIFYNSSTFSLWLNESSQRVTPDSNGIASFFFTWSSGNVSRTDLWALVYWSNGTSVAANWVRIKFDLDPPQLTLTPPSGPLGNVYVDSGGTTYVSGAGIILTFSAQDAHPKNLTLLIGGVLVQTWTYTNLVNQNWNWNTTVQSDGVVSLILQGYDELGLFSQTMRNVYVDNSPPSAPSLIYPNLNDIVNLNTPTLFWNLPSDGAGSGVDHYIVQLDTTKYFNSSGGIPSREISSVTNPNYTIPSSQPLSGTWWWRICAQDHVGNQGGYSSSRNFTVSPSTAKVNILPSNNMVVRFARTFVFKSIQIRIYVQDTLVKNVTLVFYEQAEMHLLGFWSSPANPLNTTFSWNTQLDVTAGFIDLAVRDINTYNSTNEVRLTIYVDNGGPPTPTLYYPNEGDTINLGNPTLRWSNATESYSGVGAAYYILQLDTSASFNSSNLRNVTGIAGTVYGISESEGLSTGTWYWRVAAVDYFGNVGNYSVARSFQVVTGGAPIIVIAGLGGGVSSVLIILSILIVRRRRRTQEAEAYNRKDLMAAYIFSKSGLCMFAHPFKEVRIEPQLLSGFVTAISQMMTEVAGGTSRMLKTIERRDAKILVEFGAKVTAALVAKKSLPEYRRRLNAFLNRFEHDYGDKALKWDGSETAFDGASAIVEEVFAQMVKVTTYPTIMSVEDLLVDRKLSGVAISIAGKTGSGKAAFALDYAASLLKRGDPVIIFDGTSPPNEIRERLRGKGVNIDKVEEAGLLILYDAYSEISGMESKERHRVGSPGELNTINLSLSRNLSKLKNATMIFDSLTSMIEYSDLELAADFVRTLKVKLVQGGHTALFIVDSNAHDENALNYINHVMDGEIETALRGVKKGEPERLVSIKRLDGYQIKTGYHQI